MVRFVRVWAVVAALAIVALAFGCNALIGLDPGKAAPPGPDGGSTSTSTTGTVEVCKPGSTMPCYTGPAGTEGVGLCMAGMETCNDDGSGYGDCEGEVTPQPEDCTMPVDSNCDGFVCSTSIWVDQLSNVQTTGIAADPTTGEIYFAGTFQGTATVGTTMFTSASGENDMLYAKLDSSGNVVWAKQAGSLTGAMGGAVAFLNGAVTMLGFGGVTFGGSSVPSGFFAARFADDGSPLWATGCGAAHGVVAIDPTNSDAILAGAFSTLQCGAQPHAAQGDSDIFVTRLAAANGSEQTTVTFDSGVMEQAQAVATDSQGTIFLGGRTEDTLVIGSTTFTDSMYVARLAGNDAYLWAKSFGEGGVTGLAVDGKGGLFVNSFCGDPTNDFGCGPMAAISASSDICVAKLSVEDGSCTWSRRFGVMLSGSDPTGVQSVAVKSNGDVAIAGTVDGALVLDGYVVTAAGFIAVLNGISGKVDWVDSFDFKTASIAYSKQDTLAVTATFGPGSADFGKGTIMTAPMQTDSVVFLIAP